MSSMNIARNIRELGGAFFEVEVSAAFHPRGITSALICAAYTPNALVIPQVRCLSPRGDK